MGQNFLFILFICDPSALRKFSARMRRRFVPHNQIARSPPRWQNTATYEKGALKGPLVCHSHLSLEGEFSDQGNGTSIAGEYRLRIIEDGIARSEIVQIARAVRSGEE
jgi:hypothetical protein